jgi:hypothetical protein
MLGVIASLVFIGAGFAAVASTVVTVRAQMGAVRRVIADSRSIAKDRYFLVQMTGDAYPASPMAFAKLRRVPQRAVRRPSAPEVARGPVPAPSRAA